MTSIRAATQDDRPLIFATWLRSYRHGSQFPRHIEERSYFAAHHSIIETLLDRSIVSIAHPINDPDVILGWSVVEVVAPLSVVVHFVYVKPAFRRAGIARQLLTPYVATAERVQYSHDTFPARVPEVAAHMARWQFNPYAALCHTSPKVAVA